MAMTAEELRERLRVGVGAQRTLRELRAIVVEFAAGGGHHEVATIILEDLREELGDHVALLDLHNVVCGFCDPARRVWSDDTYRRLHSGEPVKK